MSEEEQELFRMADHLVPTKDLADAENKEKLGHLSSIKALIRASHNVGGFDNICPDSFRGLEL